MKLLRKWLSKRLRKYFDYDTFDRFIKFEADFEKVFNEFKEN